MASATVEYVKHVFPRWDEPENPVQAELGMFLCFSYHIIQLQDLSSYVAGALFSCIIADLFLIDAFMLWDMRFDTYTSLEFNRSNWEPAFRTLPRAVFTRE